MDGDTSDLTAPNMKKEEKFLKYNVRLWIVLLGVVLVNDIFYFIKTHNFGVSLEILIIIILIILIKRYQNKRFPRKTKKV